jgi:hypothetical protein
VHRQTTHVLSYQHFNGRIGKGKFVCHSCDNPSCCNPEHLFLGTAKDNQSDMAGKDRVQHGSRHYRAKLSEKDIPVIRSLCQSGVGHQTVADRYGVCRQTIEHIVHGRTWKRA